MHHSHYNHAKIATCLMNQWALDFQGNKQRIFESIERAKREKCVYRCGSELEIPGYGCEDHFNETDTVNHSWEVVAELLQTDLTDGIIVDTGLPVIHRGLLYNCRLIILNRKIICLRPKMVLADDGNYREGRYFTAWKNQDALEEFSLPEIVQRATGQKKTFIGIPIIKLRDTEIAHEICEELWQPGSPHIAMSLDGAEIIFNSSGSHFSLGRIASRIDLIKEATSKSGGAYAYTNQIGCDGTRKYYDGCSMVTVNGQFISIGSRFTLQDVEVNTCVIDLDAIRSRKMSVRSNNHSPTSIKKAFPRIEVDFYFCQTHDKATSSIDERTHIMSKYSEIGYGPAVYLWDYMRKSGACAYFIPLSGGADSAASSLIVQHMCQMVFDSVSQKLPGHEFVLSELRRVLKDKEFFPKSPQHLASLFLYTCFMGTKHSSKETRDRAKKLAAEIGATHLEVDIDEIVSGFVKSIKPIIGREPNFVKHGGTMTEDLALQNVQARSRMVMSYLLAQVIPLNYRVPSYILVLGSANLDESLRGYLTKYDCSSADINPIGGFSKMDLQKFLYWCHESKGIKTVMEIIEAHPSAELRPVDEKDPIQKDEDEMGMTYKELSVFGTLRKVNKFGPVAMYKKLLHQWEHLQPDEIAEKVKRFFKFYSMNRHKMTVITPSIHGEIYGCDDNRYDLRPFLYNTKWNYQFSRIDQIANHMRLNTNKKK